MVRRVLVDQFNGKKTPETNFEPGSRTQGGEKVPETKAGAKKRIEWQTWHWLGGAGVNFLFFSWGGVR